MIHSMTGFGRATGLIGLKKFSIEIRSLNSKQMDMNLRMPSVYKVKEMDLRKYLSTTIRRGKVDVSIFYESQGEEKKVTVNQSLIESYHRDFKAAADSIGQEEVDYLSLMIRIPDILKAEKEELDPQEWSSVLTMIEEATEALIDYRVTEGQQIGAEFTERIQFIQKLAEEVKTPLDARMRKIEERIMNNLNDFIDLEKIDKNRFEQELIYFLEKLDVSEELQRLKSNCNYFVEILNDKESQGKKLGFIIQEIGREINTLGSKANDSDVQRIVVQMKDELEKIKEQILNVL